MTANTYQCPAETLAICYTVTLASFCADMAMGLVDPWVGLGWVGLGRVRSNVIFFQRAVIISCTGVCLF